MTPPVPERPALFLDFDGTLVEIADRPDGVVVAPTLHFLIERCVTRTSGAVAVVSGRRIEDIDGFLGIPIAAAGMHGLEHRAAPGDEIHYQPAPPEMDRLRTRIAAFPFLGDGVSMEDKGAGLAVHYRANPARERDVIRAMEEAIADLDTLHLICGKMVVEAKRRGFDKGAAVNSFMQRPPFQGRTPIFIGDDVTDEDGIRAANAGGGFGIKVGDGKTDAPYRLPDVEAVHAWLAQLAGVPA
ncbi:trehalose-phosphatase [Acuticoccus sediminis]|uniref:Trehalose 6-phosphate phosphatase n=1 Tax=Acuticoccus sediminis TaxID=2184697 RepID=A0A8B2NYA1_9HYPH|nr:trehalose-phosphatase [Acuticoccus sediminis]RAI03115.1 trehalose-phosphatase [Acuticoccus sediminis]